MVEATADAVPTRPAGPSSHSLCHHAQRKRVLAAHPEVRHFYGAEPRQLLAVLALVAARWGLTYCLRDSPLWLIGLVSSTVGCWLVHGLGTYIHEQGHRLIVAKEPWASWVDALLEVGSTSFGKGLSYQYKHVNFHHVYLGDYEWDSEMRDLCAHVSVLSAEERTWLVSRALVVLEGVLSLLVPAAGLISQDLVEAVRSRWILPDVRDHDHVRAERFSLPPHLVRKQRVFVALSISCYAIVLCLWGWRACLCGLWSLAVKASRFDVVGWGQDMAEHNSHDDTQPTNTTHTAWNWLFCNTGYHTEHHSFPTVPGCYLPRIAAMAPEEFGPCQGRSSYPALWAKWVSTGFKSFRITAQQVALAETGRCAFSRDATKKRGAPKKVD